MIQSKGLRPSVQSNLRRLAACAACGPLLFAHPAAAQARPAAPPPANPLWREAKIKNYLPDMTWPEVQALLARSDMVIIPVGALEQHGLQGPIGTDFLNSTEEAKLIAQRTDVLVAPILMPGNSPYHLGFPGTITLSAETLERVYFEAVQSLLQHGFRRFLLLNGHAGNTATTRFIVDRINQETPGIAVELGEASAPYRQRAPRSGPQPFDRHAGVGETSLSLYLTPNLVNLQAARKAVITYPAHLQAIEPQVAAGDTTASLVFLSEALKAKSTGKHTSTREMTDTGSWSELDPKLATAAQGQAEAETFVASAVQFIDAWKKLRPMVAK